MEKKWRKKKERPQKEYAMAQIDPKDGGQTKSKYARMNKYAAEKSCKTARYVQNMHFWAKKSEICDKYAKYV